MYELSLYAYLAAVFAFGLAASCYLWYAVASGCLRAIFLSLAAGGDSANILGDPDEVPRPEPYTTAFTASGIALLGASLALRAFVSGSGPFASLREFAPAFALGTALVYLALEWRHRVRHLGLVILPIILLLLTQLSAIPAEAWSLVTVLRAR